MKPNIFLKIWFALSIIWFGFLFFYYWPTHSSYTTLFVNKILIQEVFISIPVPILILLGLGFLFGRVKGSGDLLKYYSVRLFFLFSSVLIILGIYEFNKECTAYNIGLKNERDLSRLLHRMEVLRRRYGAVRVGQLSEQVRRLRYKKNKTISRRIIRYCN